MFSLYLKPRLFVYGKLFHAYTKSIEMHIYFLHVTVHTQCHFRNAGPPPLQQSVIWYNELPDWN